MYKKIFRISFLSFTLLSLTVAQEAGGSGKPTAAVLDFGGMGINEMEAVTLTQRLASELVKTNALIVVERNQMSEIMNEQGFQQSGCTSAECAAEIGALLGVQKMITGSFGKIGSSYTIDARIFAVESGQTEKTVSKTYKGEVDGLLTQIEMVAWELVGMNVPPELLTKAGKKLPEEAKPEEEKKSGGIGRFMRNILIVGAVGGGGYYAYIKYGGGEAQEDLETPPDPPSGHKIVIGGVR